MSRNFVFIATGFLASTLLLSGCAAVGEGQGESSPPVVTEEKPTAQAPVEEAPEASAPPAKEEAPAEQEASEPEPAPEAPAVQEESCGWDSPAINGDSGSAPSSPGDALERVIIGAWQHTHIDSGSGFEPLNSGTDIRYVFPSATRLLYCQDVAGATSQAENAADITLDGTKIVLPGSAPGYTVTGWSADTMVWTNNRDGSTYLLARR
ncbi:hypothetical protein V5R04_14225 [Jonesiaceae bacterium BS-20]|uniref:Uncharacterized protein n=1 Tax=Jonesiaceae bacterium BS-20 TaxID=3120821 RepID=A0AAU7DTR8_9MICO